MEDRRVTQQHVARKSGYSRATVSMAFKGNPSIPPKTREQILRVAARLGYAPDPMLSALAVYRNRVRPASFHGNLAWLVNASFGYDWRAVRQFVEYYEGALARARHHGYQLDIYEFNEQQMTGVRLAAIFRARNVSGLLLCPQPRSETTLDLPWDDFSSVTFGYTLTAPHLHTVISTQYSDMLLTVRQVRLRGYNRIGLVLSKEHNLRTNQHYHAGYLVSQSALSRARQIPVYDGAYEDVPRLASWMKRYRPDAVIACGGLPCLEAIRKAGLRVPEDVGLAFPNLSAHRHDLSGVMEKSVEIGVAAVDILAAMIQRGERGVPASSLRIHVEGEWHAGKTLKPANESH